MVPRPLAPARAMRSGTCADVIQPCLRWKRWVPEKEAQGKMGREKTRFEDLAIRDK